MICWNVPVPLTSCEVDNRGRSCRDGVDLRVDFMFGLVHLVLDPNLGRLRGKRHRWKLAWKGKVSQNGATVTYKVLA